MTTNDIIDPQAMGADFCWSFGDGDARACMLPRRDVRAVFSENGFDGNLIEEMDASEALKRAFYIVSKGKNIIIKQMEKHDRDSARVFGVYLVTPKDGESGDDITCGARVRVDTSTTAICLAPADCDEIPGCMNVGQAMVDIVDQLVVNVFNRDISQALLAVGAKLGWLGRRQNKGGVYYLNRRSAERFARLLKSLQRMSLHGDGFTPSITEQYNRPLTVSTWTDAAQFHYASKVDGLVRDLDRLFTDGKMKDRTIEARRDECDAILTEAKQYKQFMVGKISPLADRLAAIQDAFSKALAEDNTVIEADLRAIEKMIGKAPTRKPVPVPVAPTPGTVPVLTTADFDIKFAQ